MGIHSVQKISLSLIFLVMGVALQAQEEDTLTTERMIVIKPYSPSVSDAFKVKQTPKIDESEVARKKQPEYTVIKVPVASTFKPKKGTAATVETEPMPNLYDNYAVLGFGNYTSILAELYSTIHIDRGRNLSFSFRHNSSQGDIDGVLLDDKFYDTDIGVDFSSNSEYYNWGVEFDAMHKLINWYGLPEGFDPMIAANIDPQQSYYGVSLGGNIEYHEGLFDGAEVKFRHFGDAYGSGENYIDLATEFGVPVGEHDISLGLSLGYLSGHFDEAYLSNTEINYSTFDIGAHPSVKIHAGEFNMDLGLSLVYENNIEADENEFYLYPEIKASYRFADGYFVPYAGVDGGLTTNTYYDFVQVNPFVSPTLHVHPTSTAYNAFVGAKGKFTEQLGYNFKVNYRQDNNRALFASHAVGNTSVDENYIQGNSFAVVYDDVNTLALHGELNMDVNDDFQMKLNASFFSYNTDVQREAWNLPQVKASLNANYQITDQWSAGADLYFMGERKARSLDFVTDALDVVTLDSYFDLNLNVHYQITDQFGAFVKGHNLLGNNYERWKNFPVLGAQVLGGVTYRFNW